MNQYFGIHEDEDVHIQEVGQLAAVAPLPAGWAQLVEGGTGIVKYRCGAAHARVQLCCTAPHAYSTCRGPHSARGPLRNLPAYAAKACRMSHA